MEKQQLVYDLPTRVFHWLFVGFFLTAFVIAKTIDDDSAIYSYHMLSGMMLSFLVLLRILWGFWGTQHARFSGFALKPSDLISYMKGIFTGDQKRWAGHNPGSSWAAILMMAMALGLGVTGYLMTSGADKETFEDIHELLANGFIVVVVLHIAGMVIHTLRYRDMIALSMVNGKKSGITAEQGIVSSRPVFASVLLGLVVVFGLHLYKNYDSQSGVLKVFGSSLQLSEDGGAEGDHDED